MLGYSGRLLYSRSIGLDLYFYWAFLTFSILLIFLMKEPESKSDERSHLTLKRILEVVKQEWQGQTSFVLLDAHLSVGRDHHVYVLFLLPTENQ